VSLSDGPRRTCGEPMRLPMIDETPGAPRMPASRDECRGDDPARGICPVLRCKFNLAMHVTVSGTIVVGARGGGAHGLSLALKRTSAGLTRNGDQITTQMALAVVDLADRLPSMCALDYAERGGMSLTELAKVFGVTRERVRQMVEEIVDKLREDPEAMRFLAGWAADPGEVKT
jgi:hypothetical protein